MSTKSSLQSLLTHPRAGSATAREICDFIGPDGMSSEDAIYCPPWNPDAPKNGWSCHSRLIEGNKGNNTPTLPYCCTGHFRAISILLHVFSSPKHHRF